MLEHGSGTRRGSLRRQPVIGQIDQLGIAGVTSRLQSRARSIGIFHQQRVKRMRVQRLSRGRPPGGIGMVGEQFARQHRVSGLEVACLDSAQGLVEEAGIMHDDSPMFSEIWEAREQLCPVRV